MKNEKGEISDEDLVNLAEWTTDVVRYTHMHTHTHAQTHRKTVGLILTCTPHTYLFNRIPDTAFGLMVQYEKAKKSFKPGFYATLRQVYLG